VTVISGAVFACGDSAGPDRPQQQLGGHRAKEPYSAEPGVGMDLLDAARRGAEHVATRAAAGFARFPVTDSGGHGDLSPMRRRGPAAVRPPRPTEAVVLGPVQVGRVVAAYPAAAGADADHGRDHRVAVRAGLAGLRIEPTV
jgi:hypothetical protein